MTSPSPGGAHMGSGGLSPPRGGGLAAASLLASSSPGSDHSNSVWSWRTSLPGSLPLAFSPHWPFERLPFLTLPLPSLHLYLPYPFTLFCGFRS